MTGADFTRLSWQAKLPDLPEGNDPVVFGPVHLQRASSPGYACVLNCSGRLTGEISTELASYLAAFAVEQEQAEKDAEVAELARVIRSDPQTRPDWAEHVAHAVLAAGWKREATP